MIDSHCHIDMILEKSGHTSYSELVDQSEWWPEAIIQVASDGDRIDATLELVENHEDIFFTAGQHPHEASLYNDALHQRLIELMQHPRCVGWGECGLDYHYDYSPRDQQRKVCLKQFQAAVDLDKTIVVHSREADEEIYSILADLPKGQRIHFHCYTSPANFVEKLLSLPLDLSIGFTGIATFNNAPAVHRAIELTPIERLLVETDSPFLAPVPFRGKICHPGMVREVAKAVAAIKKIDLSEVDRITTANTRKLYQF